MTLSFQFEETVSFHFEDWVPIDGAWHHLVVHVPAAPDVVVVPRALSQEEVFDHYQQTLPSVYIDGVRVATGKELVAEKSR